MHPNATSKKHIAVAQVKVCARPGIDVMILKIFSPKKLAKIWAFFIKLLLLFAKIVIKLAKLAENCDHNIDPWAYRGIAKCRKT
jgi:hypothetical protein